MIKIKSKENSFLNTWFESLHKKFDQYHLNDSGMQVLNTRMQSKYHLNDSGVSSKYKNLQSKSLVFNPTKIEILFFLISKCDSLPLRKRRLYIAFTTLTYVTHNIPIKLNS